MKKLEIRKALEQMDKKVYFASLGIVVLMVVGLVIIPNTVSETIEKAFALCIAIESTFNVCINHFGWMYILVSVFCFGLFFYLYFGKYGNIKFGTPQDKPRFSTFSWAAMIFTSGAGSSTVILGFAEPIYYLKKAVPQLMPIIEVLDDKVRRKYHNQEVYIIDGEERVHMAHIDIHYSSSVNGVASLHTEILKNNELHHFYEIYPEKFNNKTNGITFRRWLLHCNPQLTELITSLIGDGFKKDAMQLEKLLDYKNDEKVLKQILEIKSAKKMELKKALMEKQNVTINENSIFDIQIKRLHEYKRQQLNALYVIHKYLEIKAGKKPSTPITVIFGAKAAPAYIIAQDIIHLILCLQQLINNDPEVSPYLNVVMVENYNVTWAEKLIPACDISEQISLASKEASGTGNMKFMLNGALTLGTEDGANVEIHELVGDDNIYIFGDSSDTVVERYAQGSYHAAKYYNENAAIKEAVDFITGEELKAIGDKDRLERLFNELVSKDWFMTFPDFDEYVKTREQAYADYENRYEWAKKMLVNIAKAGYFSSDRTIEEYNRDIWKLED